MTTPTTPQDEIAGLKQTLAASEQAIDLLKKQLADEEGKSKRIEFYSAGIGAWYNSALELDKSIFTLSGGGIGLIVTFLLQASTLPLFLMCIAAGLCFLASVTMILVVFQINKTFLLSIISETPPDASLLKALDKGAAIMFSVGVVLTIIIGIMASMPKLKIS